MAYYFDHKHVKEDNPAEHTDNPMQVFLIYIVLVVGAIATIGLSFAHLGGAAIYLHMLISAIQLCFVAYFWMHLQRSDSLTWLTAGSAIFIMLILFAWPLSDYLTRHLGGL